MEKLITELRSQMHVWRLVDDLQNLTMCSMSQKRHEFKQLNLYNAALGHFEIFLADLVDVNSDSLRICLDFLCTSFSMTLPI